MSPFRDLSAFPITPADSRGRVDVTALRRLLGRLTRASVGSIGLLGSTGSSPYLSRAERRRAIDTAVDEVGEAAPIIVGIGALRTDEVLELARDAKAAGAAGGLLAPISYTPLTEDECSSISPRWRAPPICRSASTTIPERPIFSLAPP